MSRESLVLPNSSFLPDIGGLSVRKPPQKSTSTVTNGDQVVSMPGINIEDDLGTTQVLHERHLQVSDEQLQAPKNVSNGTENHMTSRVNSPATTRVNSPATTRVNSPATTRVNSPATTRVNSPSSVQKEASSPSGSHGGSSSQSEPEVNICDFPKDILTDLEESFCVFDQSGDGCINPGKLHRIANYAVRDTTTEAEVQDQILEIDINGDGTVEFDEYFDMMKRRVLKPPTGKDIDKAFQVFDINQSGGIEADDLFQMLQQLGGSITQSEVKDMVKAVSGTGSKGISLQDFRHLAETSHPPQLGRILAEHGLEDDVIKVIPMANKTVAIDCFPELLDEFM